MHEEGGSEVFSIFTYNTENLKEQSTVKDIIFLSNLPPREVLEVAIFYFRGLGYRGKINIEHVQGSTYKALLEKRLKY